MFDLACNVLRSALHVLLQRVPVDTDGPPYTCGFHSSRVADPPERGPTQRGEALRLLVSQPLWLDFCFHLFASVSRLPQQFLEVIIHGHYPTVSAKLKGVKLIEDFKEQLLEHNPTLDLEEESQLYEWLRWKYQKTLQKQGPQATANIAEKDIREYFRTKESFVQGLFRFGLNSTRSTHQQYADKLWRECAQSILEDGFDVYMQINNLRSRVGDFLHGEAVAQPAPLEGLASNLGGSDEPIRYGAKQREFVKALSQFVSKGVQLHYRVSAFRRDVLGDSERTISHEEATEFVRSPAIQRLPLSFFTEAGIPVVGHTVERMPTKGAPHNLYVEPPARFIDVSGTQVELESCRWINPSGVLEKHPVAHDSVLGNLRSVCRYFAKHHPITEELAAYLVLCGGLVTVPGLLGKFSRTTNAHAGSYDYDHSTITLTVQSWVTPEQVRQAYARLRGQAIVGNTYRSKSDKNVAVFQFVMERVKLLPPKEPVPGTRGVFKFPRWRLMVEEWNKQCPPGQRFNQKDRKAEKKFRKAFEAGYQNVTGHKYFAQNPITTRRELRAYVEASQLFRNEKDELSQ